MSRESSILYAMTMLKVGDVLEGRYRIEAPIARGGMSTVYRCVDLRLGRNVAAKVMDDRYVGDPIFRQRFQREARSMAQLSHPQLVGVYDFSSEGDFVYLIMELITGGTLRELLAERGPMPPHAAAAVLVAVLTGLDVAHRAGMVHRDIKPDNILINGDHQVKLADFGLVRAASASQATSNQIVGTVSYLSPEQVSGEDITPASDVYSAGIVLFELLTGATPFSGDTQLAHAYARLDKPVPAPSTRIDGVPKLFDELVASATARDPDQRFADAGEFLSALHDVSQELKLPAFVVPVPRNSAAHRASEGLSPSITPTDLLTADIPRDELDSAAATRMLSEQAPKAPPVYDRGLESHQTRHLDPYGANNPPAQPPAPEQTALFPASMPAAQPQRLEPHYLPAREEDATSPAPAGMAPSPKAKVSNRGKGGFIVWLTTVIAFTVAVALGAWWFGSGRYGEIPQVLGMDQIQAVAAVEDAGFSTTTSEVYSDEIAAKHTVGTQPAYGDRAVKGDEITVLVSLGKPTVPELPGDGQVASYEAALNERTLSLKTGDQVFSEDVPSGAIVSTDPAVGTAVSVGSTVTVRTSKGPAPINIPDVTGLARDDAVSKLEGLGLKVSVREEFSPDEGKGDAFATEPEAGTTVPKGSAVTVSVSTAIEVPDVAGKTQKEATSLLADAGLKVGEVIRSTSAVGNSATQVSSTSPKSGSLIDPATTSVNLVLVGKVKVPNVVGKTVKEATTILEDAGLEVKVSGSSSNNAKVYWQSPLSIGSGSQVEEGTEVSIRARN